MNQNIIDIEVKIATYSVVIDDMQDEYNYLTSDNKMFNVVTNARARQVLTALNVLRGHMAYLEHKRQELEQIRTQD